MSNKKMSASLQAKLTDEAVAELAEKKHWREDQALFSLMRNTPTMYGATSDWNEIEDICKSVIREIRPYYSCRECYEFIMNIVDAYDTIVISIHRDYTDVRRLAYFVNEMLEQMIQITPYAEAIAKEYGIDPDLHRLMRGLIYYRIVEEPVRDVFLRDPDLFFYSEYIFGGRELGILPPREEMPQFKVPMATFVIR